MKKISIKTKKQILAITLITLSFLVLPNLKGSLKLLGFIERDFVLSPSNAKFESNKETHFKAYFGEKNNENEQVIKLGVNGKEFSLSLLASDTPKKTFVSPLPDNPTPTSEIKPTRSTDSAILSEPYQKAMDEIEKNITSLEEIQKESASISAQIESLSSEVASVVAAFDKASPKIEQSFFGPFESIKRKSVISDKNELVYYLQNHKLIESWTINDKLTSNKISFLYKSTDLSLEIDKGQAWKLLSSSVPVLKIITTIEDKNKQIITLEDLGNDVIGVNENGLKVDLILPKEIIDDEKRYPLTIKREYQNYTEGELTPDKLLIENVGETLAQNSMPIGPKPGKIATFQNLILLSDNQDLTLTAITKESKESKNLLTNINIDSLSCNSSTCAISYDAKIFLFNPLEIASISAVLTNDNPPSSVALSQDSLYYASLISPNGAVYKKDLKSEEESKLLGNLAFPQNLTVNSEGSLIAFWADGQILIGNAEKGFQRLSLPQKPKDFKILKDNLLYLIIYDEKINADLLARLNSKNEMEFLKSVYGNLVSVSEDQNDYLIALELNNNSSSIVRAQIKDSFWVPSESL